MSRVAQVLALPKQFGKTGGYDLQVVSSQASVQDYLDALNRAVEELPLSRSRNKGTDCAGCDLCCGERAPLTWPDIGRLRKHLGLNGELQSLLDRVAHIAVDGPVVDITLRRAEDGHCCFLDRSKKLCTIYPARPLVCQTFICCNGTGRAAGVRKWVVNLGEDELVRQWLQQAAARGEKPRYHWGNRPNLRLDDWQPNAFTGLKQYCQVLLKDILPPDLWHKLLK
ncbi:MAG: YkgJ family cysteine cluster protein [Firmicutes bacterium]|nr:YkgJ family cysteine cluster protein [Bacillota bacterium]